MFGFRKCHLARRFLGLTAKLQRLRQFRTCSVVHKHSTPIIPLGWLRYTWLFVLLTPWMSFLSPQKGLPFLRHGIGWSTRFFDSQQNTHHPVRSEVSPFWGVSPCAAPMSRVRKGCRNRSRWILTYRKKLKKSRHYNVFLGALRARWPQLKGGVNGW